MVSRPVSDEALIRRLIPGSNPDEEDRLKAWEEWQEGCNADVLGRYVRLHNNTGEIDEDIVQESLLTAYVSLECGRYQPQDGIPFVAYVIGIARNKIREARRRERRQVNLDDEREEYTQRQVSMQRQPENDLERKEQSDLIQNSLQRLPKSRRLVLEQYLTGASTVEIARRLVMSEELVRQHKCRGLRALQRELNPAGLLGKAA